jgi:hypothetical protein
MIGAGNQQERLPITEQQKWFLAGLIEGEGSVCVSIKAHPTARFGYYVDPEFFIYQLRDYKSLLELAQDVFGTGRIRPKTGNERVLVFSITSRRSIKERVLPFLKRYMVFSAKRKVYERFSQIVESMERGDHKNPKGLARLVEQSYALNPVAKGKARKRDLQEVIGRILRGHMPESTKNG